VLAGEHQLVAALLGATHDDELVLGQAAEAIRRGRFANGRA
jgi:hypothetical protein